LQLKNRQNATEKTNRKKNSLFVKDTNFFWSSEESAATVCLLATVLMVLYKSVGFKVKSVCGCWPMWLHYKIENKKTGPRRLLWWSSDSFAGEFKVKSVCGCWPMWLHYKIENKKTGPRRLLWWSSDSFAGEFSPNPYQHPMQNIGPKPFCHFAELNWQVLTFLHPIFLYRDTHWALVELLVFLQKMKNV
jgi:hypothetical protein